jgi:FixJ family two-component response regulator
MTPKQIVEDNVEQAISHGYVMGQYFTLTEEDGRYMPPDGGQSMHPLETLVAGKEIADFINRQIATKLGVSLRWVDGFVDGYAVSSKKAMSLDRLYLDGYESGKELAHIIRHLESDCADHDFEYLRLVQPATAELGVKHIFDGD